MPAPAPARNVPPRFVPLPRGAGGHNPVGHTHPMISLVSLDPANVLTISAPEQTFVVPGLEIGDAVLVFPPNALTAGVTARASRIDTANTLSVRFLNPTVGGVNAPAQNWSVVNLRGFPQQDLLINPASVAADHADHQNVTIPGLHVGDIILAIPPAALIADVDFVACQVAVANTLPLIGCNPTAGPVDAAAQVWRIVNLRGHHMSVFTIDPANVVLATAGNFDITVPGLHAGDCVLAVPPAALEAGLFPVTLRCATANTLRLRIANPTVGAVDPAAAPWVLVNFGGIAP